ncbi:unnamed protein product [Adineta steineri]|uniref:INTS8 TPR repeats domain-containing protein n=1 Tax=Adineta steineri TaxID=433720 RepID=A0A815STH1_9BILA|nr:unnamed protein product [Adineta steineri]CAF1642005.1 unnamed protein product [Adineta steineri]
MSLKLTPTDQAINILMNINHLFGQLIRILYVKAKRAQINKNYSHCHTLLTQAIDILSLRHHQDITIGQVIKYLHYNRLLFDLYEVISKQTFHDNENNLWEKYQSFLTENHSDNDTNTDVISAALAYALSPNKIQFIQSLMVNNRRIHLLTNENQTQIRPELAQELWERITDILTEKLQGLNVNKQSRNRHQQSNSLNDKLTAVELQKILININHRILL